MLWSFQFPDSSTVFVVEAKEWFNARERLAVFRGIDAMACNAAEMGRHETVDTLPLKGMRICVPLTNKDSSSSIQTPPSKTRTSSSR